MRFIGSASGGSKPTAPTIGAATDDGTGTGASVAFTPSTYIGKGTITYTATSSPGSLTASGAGSPLVVSGLTTGTAYTFTVVGTTNYGVSSAASAASNSVTPASPTSFDSIATVNPAGSNSFTFNSIPQTYKSLRLRWIANSQSGASQRFRVQFNGVTTSTSYYFHYLRGAGGAVSASSSGGTVGYISTYGSVYPGSTYYGVGILDIIDYASTSKNKTVRTIAGQDNNVSTDGNINLQSGLFINTSAITSITITYDDTSTNFTNASTFALYGIKG